MLEYLRSTLRDAAPAPVRQEGQAWAAARLRADQLYVDWHDGEFRLPTVTTPEDVSVVGADILGVIALLVGFRDAVGAADRQTRRDLGAVLCQVADLGDRGRRPTGSTIEGPSSRPPSTRRPGDHGMG